LFLLIANELNVLRWTQMRLEGNNADKTDALIIE